MKKQTKSLCLSAVILACGFLSSVPDMSADDTTVHESYVRDDHGGPGKASDLIDETAYVDQKTGAKGWFLDESGRPTTQEAFYAQVAANNAAIAARAGQQVEFIQATANESGIEHSAIADVQKNVAEMKIAQAKQEAAIKSDGANLKRYEMPKALVSKEKSQ